MEHLRPWKGSERVRWMMRNIRCSLYFREPVKLYTLLLRGLLIAKEYKEFALSYDGRVIMVRQLYRLTLWDREIAKDFGTILIDSFMLPIHSKYIGCTLSLCYCHLKGTDALEYLVIGFTGQYYSGKFIGSKLQAFAFVYSWRSSLFFFALMFCRTKQRLWRWKSRPLTWKQQQVQVLRPAKTCARLKRVTAAPSATTKNLSMVITWEHIVPQWRDIRYLKADNDTLISSRFYSWQTLNSL